MNRTQAKKIAETITNKELRKMFLSAQSGIIDWEQRSKVNKGLTKATSFNILSNSLTEENLNKEIHILTKINMIQEFGEFLPKHLKPTKKEKNNLPTPYHQKRKELK